MTLTPVSRVRVGPPAAATVAPDPRHPAERLHRLFDPGTVASLGGAAGTGVLTARGQIGGTPVIGYATDATHRGGALSAAGCGQVAAAIDLALRQWLPVVGLWHSGGAQLAEGVRALDGVGQVFAATVRASGRIPQISVVLGPAAGGAAYGPALTDIVIMSAAGRIFVTGPEVVGTVTGERVDMAQLGGPELHGRQSGVAHLTAADDPAAITMARRLVVLLGAPGRVDLSGVRDGADLAALLPSRSNQAYDVRPLVRAVLDRPGPGPVAGPGRPGDQVELHPRWARNVVTVLGRLAGRTVGVVANNPLRLAGCLDSAAAEKAARFVRMCDSLGVPLVVLVDVPGYLPGLSQEAGGVVRRGAKLLHAFAEAVVPRVTLVTRKAYGGAYIAMNSRSLGATAVFAWPQAEVAVMGAEAAVGILHRRRLAAAGEERREALRAQLVEQQLQTAGGVQQACEIGVVDEIIAPTRTRRALAAAITGSPRARGCHGNIPL